MKKRKLRLTPWPLWAYCTRTSLLRFPSKVSPLILVAQINGLNLDLWSKPQTRSNWRVRQDKKMVYSIVSYRIDEQARGFGSGKKIEREQPSREKMIQAQSNNPHRLDKLTRT